MFEVEGKIVVDCDVVGVVDENGRFSLNIDEELVKVCDEWFVVLEKVGDSESCNELIEFLEIWCWISSIIPSDWVRLGW